MSADITPGLYWRVKDSFVDYVMGGAGGRVHLGAGAATDDSGLFYPRRSP